MPPSSPSPKPGRWLPLAVVAVLCLAPIVGSTAWSQAAAPQGGSEGTERPSGPPLAAPQATEEGEDGGRAGAGLALPPPLERSPGNADYEIEASLDPESRTIEGRMVLSWTNLRDVATGELPFHLYWNAWRNDESTWMREASWRGRRHRDIRPQDWGWQDVSSIRLVSHSGPGGAGVSGTDLTERARFESPDDGNPEDRTVLVVPLPAPVAPGETVELEMEWTARVPRTFARTGHRGDFYFIAHWFPKLGVFEGRDGWACHQFHAATEFYSDYGLYDVSLTLPGEYVVGATGRLQDEGGDPRAGTKTLRFVQDDVHGFAWTASPDYSVARRTFEADGLPPVEMTLLYQPEHSHQVDRHLDATAAALEHYGTWYGPYPYGHVTVVDPAWESGAAGMEYPTLFTCGTRIFNPFGGGSPEGVTIHEAGHQFWYGLVGNDEFEHAWLDEGLNTFSTARSYAEAYGERQLTVSYLDPPGTDWGGFFELLVPEITFTRAVTGNRLDRYRPDARADVPSTPTWQYWPGTASNITYAKSSLWLATLERHLGWETLQEILSTFFVHYRYRHPEPEDFFAVANGVARERHGEDLEWFFDQVFRDFAVFDYAVTEVRSAPVELEGWVEEDGEMVPPEAEGTAAEGDETLYRSQVLVRRQGDGIFPVDVLLTFEDGTEIRRHWNGQGAWKLFTHEGPSELAQAEVDPERVLLLDVDRTNNGRRMEQASALAAAKWSSKWMVWLQDLFLTFTFFV